MFDLGLDNKVVLIKIKTFADDTAKGTFDCRIQTRHITILTEL